MHYGFILPLSIFDGVCIDHHFDNLQQRICVSDPSNKWIENLINCGLYHDYFINMDLQEIPYRLLAALKLNSSRAMDVQISKDVITLFSLTVSEYKTKIEKAEQCKKRDHRMLPSVLELLHRGKSIIEIASQRIFHSHILE